ncbi:MAG: anhydro-N-acetylmuramic acid kinase, partial [Phycisphaerales bacterium]|nr:anhydro-N-acetylmuramic acid kinase [Phycisphaerales bacterium]
HDLGRFYAEHAGERLTRKLECVGLHGQTVFHNAGGGATLQIGEPTWLAEKLRVPVVSNFRAADLAAGGQGAPLATLFHQWVFARRGEHVCVNNLGGISNVTSLDWRRGLHAKILAFDTGPANMLMDLAVTHLSKGKLGFDPNGQWASRGEPREELIACWLKHPFFRERPPKSTGRELFGEPFFAKALKAINKLSRFDVLATLTEFSARAIAMNYTLHLPSQPDRVIVCGGGALNPVLVNALRRAIGAEVITCEALGWPAQAIEPAAFALLAWLRLRGRPGNIPATTGARRSAVLGQITAS